MSWLHRLAGLVLSTLVLGCTTPPVEREIAFAKPPAFNQCPAEFAVDWEGSLSWVNLDEVEARQTSIPRQFPELAGDDVVIEFYAGANIHVGRTNYARAFRRDGIWTYVTSESPDSRAPPPPPPPPPPPGEEAAPVQTTEFSCSGYHYKASGLPGDRLVAALEAFLADGCRAYVPGYIPAPLFMRDENGRDCSDGASYRLRVETAHGVEHYSRGCNIPNSSLETLMSAFEEARSPVNAQSLGPGYAFSVTLPSWRSHWDVDRACRAEAQTLGLDIDFDDPFQW